MWILLNCELKVKFNKVLPYIIRLSDWLCYWDFGCHSDSCVSLYCTILRLLTFNWNGIVKPPHKYKSFLTFVPLCSCSRQTFGISSRHQIENIPHEFFYWSLIQWIWTLVLRFRLYYPFIGRCILDSSLNVFGIWIRQQIENPYRFKYIPTKLDQRFMNIIQIFNLS